MPRGNEEDENVAALRSVLAVSLDDGTEAWRFTEPRGNASVPAVADDRVYVACGDDHLYAVDATGGTRRWRTEIPLAPTSPPAVVDGTVYAASTDGHVYAVDAGSGEVAYRADAGAPLEAGLAVVDEVNEESQYEGWRQRLVYAGTVEETLAVVKTDSRSVRSTVDLGAPVAGPPAVRDRLVHVGTDDGNVHVLGE
jgi:outer membrane protein assembly factor BamB